MRYVSSNQPTTYPKYEETPKNMQCCCASIVIIEKL